MRVSYASNTPQQPKVPFLWQSAQGCIYLRNREGWDIIICPTVQDDKIGVAVKAASDLYQAWTRRLPDGATITIGQT